VQKINNLAIRLARYRPLLEEATQRVLTSGWLVLGPETAAFEKEFAAYVGVDFAVGVGNGSDAIELALRALGVEAGDVVATVANAGMYTCGSILHLGAVPFFMDVDLQTQCVSVAEVEAALEAGVRAVVVTHLYGRAVPGIELMATLCADRGVPLIEDCAQAHGACVAGRRVGAFGDAACFSFYPTKNLGGLGDGGAVVCRDQKTELALRQLRQYGWSQKYTVSCAGGRNSRLDELQSAYLRVFLPYLDSDNASRRHWGHCYERGLKNPWVKVPADLGENHVVHLFVVLVEARESLAAHLYNCGIATDIHYPIPDHRQPILAGQAARALPCTELLATQVLTLPCYPEMTEQQVAHVVESVNSWRP